MWPFKKKPTVFYKVTSLQIGDECICVRDYPHEVSHQQLLKRGKTYVVRDVYIDGVIATDGFGGPWIRLDGIWVMNDMGWSCIRFEKIIKSSILTQVMEPIELDTEKAREEAY